MSDPIPTNNPLTNPGVYDYVLLDGKKTPGLCLRTSGGERKQKWDAQQSPQTAGAFTVFKGEEVAFIEYQFVLWEPAHFPAIRSLVDSLRAGTKKRPPKVWDLVDETISHNEIKAVAVASIGRLEQLGPTKWAITVGFTEYKKRKPVGGAITPGSDAKTQAEGLLKAAERERAALEKQLAAQSYDAKRTT